MAFLRIVFTSPEEIQGEAGKVVSLLERKACDILHLRKPLWTEDRTSRFLEQIPENLHSRIMIHDHFRLCDVFDLCGVHLNRRNPDAYGSARSVSRSCHSLDEVEESGGLDYVTLSPIYDSISKLGYSATVFEEERLSILTRRQRIVALGGISPYHFKKLGRLGFSGAALLGYVWNNPEGKSFDEVVDTLRTFAETDYGML